MVLEVDRGDNGRRPITLTSVAGETAKLAGTIVVNPGVRGLRLSRLRIEGLGAANVIKIYGANVVVEDSDITNARRRGSCILLGSPEHGPAMHPIVRRNVLHDCGDPQNLIPGSGNAYDHAIYAANVVGGVIVDNVFWGSAGKVIQLYPHARRTRVAHNVIDAGQSVKGAGVVIAGTVSDPSSHNVVERNIIAYAPRYNVYASWDGQRGSGNLVRSNCLWRGRSANVGPEIGFDAVENVTADPLFLDRSSRDYRLAEDSECLRVVGYDTAAKLEAGGTLRIR
jgi:hypothetical protein